MRIDLESRSLTEFVFLNPGLLWGIIAAVVPIAIFLFLQRQVRVELWGASRFLTTAIERKRRRVQLHSFLPLMLKILAIIALVLGTADPRLQSENSQLVDQTSKHRLVIADVSMSLQAIREGETLFQSQQRQLFAISDRAKDGDSWQLLLHGTKADSDRVSNPSYQTDQMRAEFNSLTPTYERGNLLDTLERAVRLAKDFPSDQAEILFFTDCQQNEWTLDDNDAARAQSLFEKLCSMGSVSLVKLTEDRFENLSIHATNDHSDLGSDEEKLVIGAMVSNFGERSRKTHVDLLIDGEYHASQVVNVDAQESIPVEFELGLTQPGRSVVQLQIDDDKLMGDNELWTGISVPGPTKILILGASKQGETPQPVDFLRTALATNSHEEDLFVENELTSVVDHSQVSEVDLSLFDVVFLCDVPTNDRSIESIAGYVEQGGCLVVSLGIETDTSQADEFFKSVEFGFSSSQIVPVAIDLESASAPFRFQTPPLDHPIVNRFRDRPEAGFATTRIYRYFKFVDKDSLKNQFSPIIKLDNGDHLMCERQVGLGQVILVMTGFDTNSGSWVLWPSFVPIINETVRHLMSPQNDFVNSVIGQELPETLLDFQNLEIIRNASNDEIIWNSESHVSDWSEIDMELIGMPGAFQLEDRNQNRLQTLLRNIDPLESDLRYLSDKQLRDHPILRGLPVRITESVSFSQSRQQSTLNGDAVRPARWLFALALTLLIIDQVSVRSLSMAIGMLLGLILAATLCMSLPLPTDRKIATIVAFLILGGLLASRFQFGIGSTQK